MFSDEQIALMSEIHDISFDQDGATRVQIHGNGLIDIYYHPFPNVPDLIEEKKIILTMDELLRIYKLMSSIFPGFAEELATSLNKLIQRKEEK